MDKINLGNRTVLEDGTVICETAALVEILYAGQDIQGTFCLSKEDQEEWDRANIDCDTDWQGPVFSTTPAYQSIDWYDHWFTPEPYASINLTTWCLERCKTQEEIDRVIGEIKEYESRNMIPIMKHLIYCVDVWRKHKILWGVGRGSSVCSFVLYLIGINRINPLKFNLPLDEWLHK